MMTQRDYKVGPGREVNLDSWDGYAPERTRLFGRRGARARTAYRVTIPSSAQARA
ncbi:hypothetical protein [Nonomuraea sp. NPDC050691]|uniref:hypothetical protein n=1 Tax=Nonomuraea sp. NPDC050691 TaxID=3155661 RepID=UPI0033E7CAFF